MLGRPAAYLLPMSATPQTNPFVEKAALELYVPPAMPSLVGLTRAELADALGEVGSRSDPGEGDYRERALVVIPPHPDPLPASGARETTADAALASDKTRVSYLHSWATRSIAWARPLSE